MSTVYLIAAMVMGWAGGHIWESRRRYSMVSAHRGLAAMFLCAGVLIGCFVGHYLTLRGWL